MINYQRTDISSILNNIAQALDLTDSLFEEAERKYKAVGAWLGEGNSPLASYSPEIYPQGSFGLGTVVRPLNDDYDLDLAFQLAIAKGQISPYDLKKLVGDRLKANETYRRMLDVEGRRCWTLQYADGARFHLDILPAIPDSDFPVILKSQGLPFSWAETSIAITDRNWPNYYAISSDWPRSNPRGFAAWFRGRMLVQFVELRKQLAEATKAEIATVPDYKIKTPLQRCVQLLKRNRDISFANDPDDQPISIILTSLAANAYNNESDILDALINIVRRMPDYITIKDGKAWIQNPVDPLENFADRWQGQPQCERKLRAWLKGLELVLVEILECKDTETVSRKLETLFGEKITKATIQKYMERAGARANPIYPVITITHPNKPWGY
jgi:hypothetical protein